MTNTEIDRIRKLAERLHAVKWAAVAAHGDPDCEEAAVALDAILVDNQLLQNALTFYSKKQHLYGSLENDWGRNEDAGWLWPEEESWGVEDGLIARKALSGEAT